MATLFTDFLTALGVRHTEAWSDRQFWNMPFQSLFGLAKLLQSYGIETAGVECADKAAALAGLPRPFIADTPRGLVIVTGSDGSMVSYLTQGRGETIATPDFLQAWNGIALLARRTARAGEPGYGAHRRVELADILKGWLLKALPLALWIYLMVANSLASSWTAWVISALDMAGLLLSWMLVEKSLGIKNAKADAVCSVLEEGGCDSIAKSAAASFMGIVKWSEVGLAYFSVSLAAFLVFPEATRPWLALINACCLPYTLWSIGYQKFVARTWCTLCVSVQACLWALFAFYLAGGWWTGGSWTPGWGLWVLVGCYVLALVAINAFDRGLSRLLHPQSRLVNPVEDASANSDTAGNQRR